MIHQTGRTVPVAASRKCPLKKGDLVSYDSIGLEVTNAQERQPPPYKVSMVSISAVMYDRPTIVSVMYGTGVHSLGPALFDGDEKDLIPCQIAGERRDFAVNILFIWAGEGR